MRSLHAVILAAGGGTRMKSSLPKVLHTICGRPMIAYALDLVAASGVKRSIAVLGEENSEAIKAYLPKDVRTVIQKTASGTGDALLAARRSLDGLSGHILVLYADTPLLRRTTIQRLIEMHYRTSSTCTLLTTHLADPSGYGRIVRDPNGMVVKIVEEAEASASERAIREVNVGPVCVKAQPLFDALALVESSSTKKERYLTQAMSLVAQQENVKLQTVRVDSATEAFGVNSRAHLAKAMAIVRQRIIEAHMGNGVTIVDPQMTYIDHGVVIGSDTVIYPGTVIESGVTIGRRCRLGPYARLRGGVAVSDDARIGNFVELVRTKVGARVQMHHMTYLGDATVEDEVNIGAGTITANFDGTEKLPTTIGKGAFIGCDTVMIAPVKIGPRAVTGAGSVIPKGHDVPSRGVVVGVPARLLDQKASVKPAAETAAVPVSRAVAKGKKGKAKASRPAKRVKAKVTPRRAVKPTSRAARKGTARPRRAATKPRLRAAGAAKRV